MNRMDALARWALAGIAILVVVAVVRWLLGW